MQAGRCVNGCGRRVAGRRMCRTCKRYRAETRRRLKSRPRSFVDAVMYYDAHPERATPMT